MLAPTHFVAQLHHMRSREDIAATEKEIRGCTRIWESSGCSQMSDYSSCSSSHLPSPEEGWDRGGEALEGTADLGTETGAETAKKGTSGITCSPACTALTSKSILLQRRDALSEKGLLPAQKSLQETPEKNLPSTTPPSLPLLQRS